jgi:hypothetical protein
MVAEEKGGGMMMMDLCAVWLLDSLFLTINPHTGRRQDYNSKKVTRRGRLLCPPWFSFVVRITYEAPLYLFVVRVRAENPLRRRDLGPC